MELSRDELRRWCSRHLCCRRQLREACGRRVFSADVGTRRRADTAGRTHRRRATSGMIGRWFIGLGWYYGASGTAAETAGAAK